MPTQSGRGYTYAVMERCYLRTGRGYAFAVRERLYLRSHGEVLPAHRERLCLRSQGEVIPSQSGIFFSCLSTPPFLNRQFHLTRSSRPPTPSRGYGIEETPLIFEE